MTEAYLDLPDTIKQYGEARALVDEQDDLSERSTISQMPLNFNLITDFKTQDDLTPDKVHFGSFKNDVKQIWDLFEPPPPTYVTLLCSKPYILDVIAMHA